MFVYDWMNFQGMSALCFNIWQQQIFYKRIINLSYKRNYESFLNLVAILYLSQTLIVLSWTPVQQPRTINYPKHTVAELQEIAYLALCLEHPT